MMKKKNVLYLLLLICSFGLFSACDKNEDEPVLPVDQELAGTYKGLLGITVNNTSVGGDVAQKIYISKSSQGDNLLKLELKDFSFGTMKLGDITVDACPVTKTGETYAFTGENTLKLSAPIGTCPVKVAGTIEGAKISINIGVTVEALGQDVTAKFAGTKLNGNENKEAKILTFTFDSELVTEQPVIDEANGTITFKVVDTATEDQLKALVPTFTVSEKATVSPASGVAQDFSNSAKVAYSVVAEDGTVKIYQVSIAGSQNVTKYSFEEWIAGVEGQKPELTFYEPKGWSSSNTGAHFLKAFALADRYVVSESNDAHSGEKAARIETIDTKGADMGFAKVPKVTTGTLFLGTFITDLMNTLNSTKFGLPFSKKPLYLKGFYKYTPGDTYYTCASVETCNEATVDKNAKDECAISVVLYSTEKYDEADWTDCLTGTTEPENNIYASSRIVAIGSLVSGEQKDWSGFTIKLDYKQNYDPNKKYRLTIACSSSKNGDQFKGAPGSVLFVDDLELVAE